MTTAVTNPTLNPTQGLYNALIPKEGPRVYPLSLDFSADTSFSLDLLQIVNRGYMSFIQTIFVDNSLNDEAVTITPDIAYQPLKIPPRSQGYLPILVPNQPKLVFSSSGGVKVVVNLLNIPLPAQVWATDAPFAISGGSLVVVSGKLQVADPVLDGAVLSGKVLTQNYQLGSGDTLYPAFAGTKGFLNSAFSTTGDKTLITGAPGWFATGFSVDVSHNFSPNASGTILTIKETGTSALGTITTMNLTAATIGRPITIEGLQILGKATASAVLACSVNNAPAAGNITVTAFGGTTSLIQA